MFWISGFRLTYNLEASTFSALQSWFVWVITNHQCESVSTLKSLMFIDNLKIKFIMRQIISTYMWWIKKFSEYVRWNTQGKQILSSKAEDVKSIPNSTHWFLTFSVSYLCDALLFQYSLGIQFCDYKKFSRITPLTIKKKKLD